MSPDHETKQSDVELDVRILPHAQRHATIFAILERLQSGQALIITNDHDPMPLGYQLQAIYGDKYSWSYLENGPEKWRVAMRKEG